MITISAKNPISKSGKRLPALKNFKRESRWRQQMLDLAKIEAKGNDWEETLLKGINPKNFSFADGETLNLITFNDPDVKIDWS